MGIRIDANPDDRDWAKRSWDFPDVNSVPELLRMLEAQGMTVEQFKELPVYRFNVDRLAWLREL